MSSNIPDHSRPEGRAKAAQLIIGLKFHYGKTLEEIPLDVAVDAMVKVWESCNSQTSNPNGLMDDAPRKISPPKTIHL